MYHNSQPIVLASSSQRRRQYLHDMGLVFTVYSVPIDEQPGVDEEPEVFVTRMAREKAAAVRKLFPESWIISGDTVVCLGKRIFGKPLDAVDAVRQLMALSGREHVVRSGFCVTHGVKGVEVVGSIATRVRFARLNEVIARAYVTTGECFDKAGGYAIQGKGACLVESIVGSYSNVVGMPLYELLQVLQEQGVVEPVGALSVSCE